MVNVGSTSTGCRILSTKKESTKILLNQPVCTEIGEKVAISRRIDNHWRYILFLFLSSRLIGWGQIIKGVSIEPLQN